jgi:putative membrane protein
LKFPLALRNAEERKQLFTALRFLVPLGVGVIIAYYLATKLLVGKSEDPGLMIRPETAPACYAFFFGLVLLSIREPWRRIKNANAGHYVAAVLGAAAAAIFVGLPHATQEPATWVLFLGGAGAISVMIMPGVSGSLLLVILGLYQTVVNAVHDRDFAILAVFLLGIGAGVLLFVPTLRLLLKRHHDLTMAALTGLMAGSLRALWPWKTSYDIKKAELVNTGIGDHLFMVIVAALAGAAVVYLLAMLEHRFEEAD